MYSLSHWVLKSLRGTMGRLVEERRRPVPEGSWAGSKKLEGSWSGDGPAEIRKVVAFTRVDIDARGSVVHAQPNGAVGAGFCDFGAQDRRCEFRPRGRIGRSDTDVAQ